MGDTVRPPSQHLDTTESELLWSLAIAKIQAEILPRNADADWEPKFGRRAVNQSRNGCRYTWKRLNRLLKKIATTKWVKNDENNKSRRIHEDSDRETRERVFAKRD